MTHAQAARAMAAGLASILAAAGCTNSNEAAANLGKGVAPADAPKSQMDPAYIKMMQDTPGMPGSQGGYPGAAAPKK